MAQRPTGPLYMYRTLLNMPYSLRSHVTCDGVAWKRACVHTHTRTSKSEPHAACQKLRGSEFDGSSTSSEPEHLPWHLHTDHWAHRPSHVCQPGCSRRVPERSGGGVLPAHRRCSLPVQEDAIRETSPDRQEEARWQSGQVGKRSALEGGRRHAGCGGTRMRRRPSRWRGGRRSARQRRGPGLLVSSILWPSFRTGAPGLLLALRRRWHTSLRRELRKCEPMRNEWLRSAMRHRAGRR